MPSSLEIIGRTKATPRLRPASHFALLILAALLGEIATAPMTVFLGAISFGVGVYFIPGLFALWLNDEWPKYNLPAWGRILGLAAALLLVPSILLVYVLRAFRNTGALF